MDVTVTRGGINCTGEDCDYDRYPLTGHRCEYGGFDDVPRCEAEATVALTYSDGSPVIPFVCDPHAKVLEADPASNTV